MEFQLVLTEECNLACEYCYIKQKPIYMTKEIFDKHYEMLPKLMKEYNQHDYVAALFGGEPLLNWKLIEYIIPILKNDPKCKFIIAMTNGLEFKKDYKRKFFEDNNISFSLSFDGLWNKTNRKLKNGKSSFDEYMKEPLKSYFSSKGGCKVMVSPNCVPTMVDNFKWFVEEYKMPCPDFSLVRDDIWTDYDVANFEIECHLLADKVIEYFNNGIYANVGFFQLYTLDLLFGKAYGKRPHGCFAGCSGAGFMPDGSIYPCARFGSDKTMRIGNSLDSSFDLPNLHTMKNPNITNPQTYNKCLECELYNYCNAGCTRVQLQNSDDPLKAEPVENVCKILKTLYKNTMRISRELKNNKLYRESVLNSIKNIG